MIDAIQLTGTLIQFHQMTSGTNCSATLKYNKGLIKTKQFELVTDCISSEDMFKRILA